MATSSDMTSRYNELPTIQEQGRWSRTVPILIFLESIARIFQTHGVQDLAVVLVHRHCILPIGHAILHATESPTKKICKVVPLEDQPLYPCAYRLHAGTFEPYEFSSTMAGTPGKAFLNDLASFLNEHDLSHRIGICCSESRPTRGQIWIETQSTEEKVITRRDLLKDTGLPAHYTITEWVIDASNGFEVREYTGCDDGDPAHRRK